MYKIQDNDVISKSNGYGRYHSNHIVADASRARIESNWKQLKKRVVDAVIVTTVTLSTLAVLTLTSGCASKQHSHLHTQESVSNRYAVSATATTKSRSVSMALNSAKHRCRVELANKLNTEMLYNSRVVYQDISRSTDGLYYTATVVVAIPQ